MKLTSRKYSLSIGLAFLGIFSLGYLLGAADLFFDLFLSGFLNKAFVGARHWQERQHELAQAAHKPVSDQQLPLIAIGPSYQPEKAFNGYTLISVATLATSATQAQLINMRGEVVHKWSVRFSDIWPKPPHVPAANNASVCFFALYLYPNGDLLAVFHGVEQLLNGYGVVKLDKNSKVLWSYAGRAHHDVDVDEDGNVYTLQHAMVDKMPPGLEAVAVPKLVDYVVKLSPEGKPLRPPMPLLEAFLHSPYAALLDPLKCKPMRDDYPLYEERIAFSFQGVEAMHANCVHVLPRKLAAKFPQFKAGQVLISLRLLDTIAVLDVDKGVIVWAARGPWRRQHDPQFLENGHLLIFDNLGFGERSRVLEYDPITQAIPWSCSDRAGEPFVCHERGMSQRLANGNTLIVNSEGEIFEVTASKELVWSCRCADNIRTARRYSPSQVPFLKMDDPR